MTVAELLARISSEELTEWQAYEKLTGPLGHERGDMLHGIATASIVNALRGRGRRARGQDFIPKWDRAAQSWESMLAAVKTINKALGGVDKTSDKTEKAGGGPRGKRDRRHPRVHRSQER